MLWDYYQVVHAWRDLSSFLYLLRRRASRKCRPSPYDCSCQYWQGTRSAASFCQPILWEMCLRYRDLAMYRKRVA